MKKSFSIFLLLFLSLTAHAYLKLPRLISDGMVLQRNAEVKIWGWASPNERISVNFIDSDYSTAANESGEWEIMLSGLEPGGPNSMKIFGEDTVTIKDILVGDIWICSGQSNMETSMKRVSPLYEKEIADANNPWIRYFEVPKTYNFNAPQKDLPGGKWQPVTLETIWNISAVSYFFGLELHTKYNIPIGLINSAVGGSPAEAWISEDAIRSFPEYFNEAQRFKDSSLIRKIEDQDRKRSGEWYRTLRKNDEGYKDPNNPWYSQELNTSDWSVMNIPGYWADKKIGEVNGVVWFRKEVIVPAFDPDKPAKLLIGRIVDADSVFVNGAFVGATGYQYPPRRYEIPPNLLKEGNNTITVRIINERGQGGFVVDKPYELILDQTKIDLTGPWQYKLGAAMPSLESQTFVRLKPTGLYNAMIAPLLNYRIKGVIWYQGESNTESPMEYERLFPAVIKNWRVQWNQGDFPFLFVQLANFMEAKDHPTESNWAQLREAQRKTLALPNTGMAVTIDIGEWNDIHPLNKKDVSKRLALAAQKVAYGEEKVVYSGPVLQSMEINGSRIILSFNCVGSGLVSKDGKELRHFSIAGKDHQYVWANASIENNQVIVWSPKVPNPVSVRYAWADNPEGVNLYNKEGLPASPFETGK